jgi:hypothetical protein
MRCFDSYELRLFPDETRRGYEAIQAEDGKDSAEALFRALLPTAKAESLALLEEMGILPEKIGCVKLLSMPDETGEVLFLCTAGLAAELIRGGEQKPRQSAEEAGISMVFVGEEGEQNPLCVPRFTPHVEMRFVLPLTAKEELLPF